MERLSSDMEQQNQEHQEQIRWRRDKTILKPRVPTKLTNNIGKSEACFTRLAIIQVSTGFHLKIKDTIRLLIN
jgi:hypothetical protein